MNNSCLEGLLSIKEDLLEAKNTTKKVDIYNEVTKLENKIDKIIDKLKPKCFKCGAPINDKGFYVENDR